MKTIHRALFSSGWTRRLLLFTCLMSPAIAAYAQQWESDLQHAARTAASSQKKILLYFSVNELCEVCRNLERDVFASPEFLSFAADHFVMVRPSFSDADSFEEKSEKLLIVEKYNKDGFFPHVVILDRHLKILGKMPVYNGESASEVIATLRTW